jgi:hypothetical protein
MVASVTAWGLRPVPLLGSAIVRIAIVVLLVLLPGAVVWLAGEQHYTGCVTRAEAATPIVTAGQASNGIFANGPTTNDRRRAINGCSRWPW